MTAGRPAFAAVLLDLDGTLVDSERAVVRAWRAWAAGRGLDVETILADSAGRPAGSVIAQAAPGLSEDDLASEAAMLLAVQYGDLVDVRAAAGAGALVETLASMRLPWAVVTSADRRLAWARLAAAGLRAPELVTVEDVRLGKPAPEGYLLAAERLGVEPPHCLVVEDSAAGVEAGRRAGMTVAGLRGAGGDVSIGDLSELVPLLTGRRTAAD